MRWIVQLASLIITHWIEIYPMDSAIQLLNNWGLVFHWWLRNRINYSRRLPLQIWKRPSPANPRCKKPTSQKRKEKLWEKVSPFPHWGWVDGELIRNATYRSYEAKNVLKRAARLIGLLERLVASYKTQSFRTWRIPIQNCKRYPKIGGPLA